jgi:hypothetical protein
MTERPFRPSHTELEFACMPGRGCLRERLSGAPDYKTAQFLDHEVDDIDLRMGHSTDQDFTEHVGPYVEISFWNTENPETGRVFHSQNYAFPNWEQIRQLRDYCDFLLKLRPAGGDQP